ncbi:ATP-binding protein [Oligoflexaceae bacterium]|nr:ATP-binding protein [Oligoflexaceae bacterium]
MKRIVTVALIEGDLEDRAQIIDSLNELSHQEIEFITFDCIEKFREHCNDETTDNNFDIILSDMYLPDSEGLSTVLTIHSIIKTSPLIILSGVNDDEVAIQSVAEGAQDYFDKSTLNTHELILKMNYAIERQKLINDLSAAKSTIQKHAEFKSRFLAQMSHEIRTPMNGVIGNVSLLLRTDLTPEQEELVTSIHSSGDNLIELINDILEISKFESGTLVLKSERFSIRQIVEEVLDSFSYLSLEKKILLVNNIDPKISKFGITDSNRLKQILINLVGNALKFTKKGKVEVRASFEDQNNRSRLQFEVSDTGKGISLKHAEKLFKPFEQSDYKDQFEGTGLGLSICSQLIERMGGKISVKSKVGAGTTFTFSIQCPSRDSQRFPRADLSDHEIRIYSDDLNFKNTISSLAEARGVKQRFYEASDIILNENLDPKLIFALDFLEMEEDKIDKWIASYKQLPNFKQAKIFIFSAKRPAGIEDYANIQHMGHVIRQSYFYRYLADLVEVKETQIKKIIKSNSTGKSSKTKTSKVKNVLVVDDVVANLKIVEKMLMILGHKSVTADSGYDALSLCENEEFDIILMDCQMPGIDGFEAAQMIKNGDTKNSKVPIVALTADVLVAKDIIDSSFDGYIAKPIKVEDIEDLFKDNLTLEKEYKPKKDQTPESTSLNNATLCMLRDLGEGNDDNSFLDGLIDTFTKETPHIISDMKHAVKNGRHNAINHLAHKLKGFSRNLGVEELANECEVLEHNSRKMTKEQQSEKLNHIIQSHLDGISVLKKDWHSIEK